jgi:hypothetical protein
MEEDPLDEFDDTNRLYQQVKKYLAVNYQGKPRITKDTPFPIVAVWINKCIKRFSYTYRQKPPEKVLYLCFKFLDEIGYER